MIWGNQTPFRYSVCLRSMWRRAEPRQQSLTEEQTKESDSNTALVYTSARTVWINKFDSFLWIRSKCPFQWIDSKLWFNYFNHILSQLTGKTKDSKQSAFSDSYFIVVDRNIIKQSLVLKQTHSQNSLLPLFIYYVLYCMYHYIIYNHLFTCLFVCLFVCGKHNWFQLI